MKQKQTFDFEKTCFFGAPALGDVKVKVLTIFCEHSFCRPTLRTLRYGGSFGGLP